LLLLSVSVFFSSHVQTISPYLPASEHPGYHEYLPLNYILVIEKCTSAIVLQENGEIGICREPDICKVTNHGLIKEIHVNKHDKCYVVNGKQECFNLFVTQVYSGASFFAAEFQNIYNHILHSYRIDSNRIYINRAFKWAVNNINSPNKLAAHGIKPGTTDCKTTRVMGSINIPIWSHNTENELDMVNILIQQSI
jgi:predicted peptidase